MRAKWWRIASYYFYLSTFYLHILRCPSLQVFQNNFRNSLQQLFFRRGVLKNFAIFTGKNFCLILQHMCFPMNIAKFLRTAFFYRTPLVAAYNICVKIRNFSLTSQFLHLQRVIWRRFSGNYCKIYRNRKVGMFCFRLPALYYEPFFRAQRRVSNSVNHLWWVFCEND